MKLIVLNNKCFLSYQDTLKYKEELDKIKIDKDLVLLPNIAYLSEFKDVKYQIGVQNFYSYNFGAYTGEVSLASLKDLNVTYTLVGHPERIELKLDSYEVIKDKLFKSLNSNFKTILCIGRDGNFKTIKKELKYYLKGIEHSSIKNLIIAYEPTNIEIIDKDDIIYIMMEVKEYIKKHYDREVSFIYGGLVDKDNIQDIIEITDGVIIGKESSDIKVVKEILSKSK